MNVLRIVGLWGPVLAFMILTRALASSPPAVPVSGHWDKALHLAAYGVFGVLCLRAFHGGFGPPRAVPALLGMLLALGWAAADELHQASVPGRMASVGDWVADALGAVLALGLFVRVRRGATAEAEPR